MEVNSHNQAKHCAFFEFLWITGGKCVSESSFCWTLVICFDKNCFFKDVEQLDRKENKKKKRFQLLVRKPVRKEYWLFFLSFFFCVFKLLCCEIQNLECVCCFQNNKMSFISRIILRNPHYGGLSNVFSKLLSCHCYGG